MDFDTNERLHASLKYCSELQLNYGSAWRHLVCEDDGPENRDNKKLELLNGQVLWIKPHARCTPEYEEPDPRLSIDFWDHETMRLTLLRTCRQAYVEANAVLWMTNTFDFEDAITFKRFMMTRNIHQKRLVKSLRFQMDWNMDKNKSWNSVFNMPLIRSLSGLRCLRLCIFFQMEAKLYELVKSLDLLFATTYCDGLQKLSILPLTEVEVVVKGPLWRLGGLMWTKRDRQEFSDGLRKVLLDPKGAKIYEENQRKLKEQSRRQREVEAQMKIRN